MSLRSSDDKFNVTLGNGNGIAAGPPNGGHSPTTPAEAGGFTRQPSFGRQPSFNRQASSVGRWVKGLAQWQWQQQQRQHQRQNT